MSVSISYRAKRDRPVSQQELDRIRQAVELRSVDHLIEAFLAGAPPDGIGNGLNWESFIIYDFDTLTVPVILEGSTKLPDNTDDAMWIGVQHWSVLLSMLRRVLIDAEWQVFVQDHELKWDETNLRYDPYQ